MTLVLWTETTNASARSYERRHLSRSTSRKSVAGSVSSYRTSRREIASPTTGDQQGGCKTLEKLQTTGRGRRWGSPGQSLAAAAAEASSAPAGRRGAPAGAAAAVGGELEEGGARATSGWNLSKDSRKSATAQAAPPFAPPEGCWEDVSVSFWSPLPLPRLLRRLLEGFVGAPPEPDPPLPLGAPLLPAGTGEAVWVATRAVGVAAWCAKVSSSKCRASSPRGRRGRAGCAEGEARCWRSAR